MDFVADGLASGRRLRTLNVVDVFTRECLAIEVDHVAARRESGKSAWCDRIAERVEDQKMITVDNGPEFICRALDAWAFEHGVTLHFIDPGKPTQNAHVESFNSKFRDECLAEAHWPAVPRARFEIAV